MVRLAVHARTGLRYAVKTVRKAQLRRWVEVEDLRREVQILSLLSSHPNVAALLQTYEDVEAVHIVLELVRCPAPPAACPAPACPPPRLRRRVRPHLSHSLSVCMAALLDEPQL